MAVPLRGGDRPRGARLRAHRHPPASWRRPDLARARYDSVRGRISSSWGIEATFRPEAPSPPTPRPRSTCLRRSGVAEGGRPVEEADGVEFLCQRGRDRRLRRVRTIRVRGQDGARMSAAYLALDLGAESGRVVLGRFDGERVSLEEVHRFPNMPVAAARRVALGRSADLLTRSRRDGEGRAGGGDRGHRRRLLGCGLRAPGPGRGARLQPLPLP